MDRFINRSPAYAGRAEVLADALAAFLAEVEAPTSTPVVDPPTTGVNVVALRVEAMAPILAAAALELQVPTGDVPLADPVPGLPRREFTWGMHNRDFPTLWVAHHLGMATAAAASLLSFADWLPAMTRDAWRVALAVADDRRFDVSGFPTNTAKWDKAEARFVTFFVGTATGTGPLFDLGLAGIDALGRCALTEEGAAVLEKVAGWGAAIEPLPSDRHRRAWLAHLAHSAPADIDLFDATVAAIASGANTRDQLMLAVAERYERWSTSQVSTNTAAAVSRLREVGLLERRQVEGRYVLCGPPGWAASELGAARASAVCVPSRHAEKEPA